MTDVLATAVYECYGGYRWYVIAEQGHVVAQGFMRSKKRAETAALNTMAQYRAELGVF